MPLETEIVKLTAAVEKLTAVLEAAGTPANVTPIKVAPAPDAEAPAPGEIELPDKIERKAPAKKAAKEAPAATDDTPSVPAKTAEPGGPAAAEHVDEDEVIAEIMQVVKAKITEATAIGEGDGVKEAWTAIRKKFGVERISELKGRPADLLAALKAAQGL